ncbi:MAG: RagB/SusD family nutrient uptake outer membrane protein [Mangrovibacterium sp.]
MKPIYKMTGMIILALFAITSCNEEKFLEEKPLAIYSADNTLVTSNDFQAAVNMLYKRPGNMFFYSTSEDHFAYYYATDLAFCAADVNKLNKYAPTMIPEGPHTSGNWNNCYFMVNQANLILTRIKDVDIPEADKNTLRGEALFFRAFGYRVLANLYGGVPLITEEITAPRRDFVKATRQEVYMQAKNDLTEAISLLSNIDAIKDGKISRQMAQHLLSEVYISLGDYDNAISTATAVIDYPAIKLMTERFGTKLNQPGDVYSDLFKTGNINRSSGNTEALWVMQYDYLNPATLSNDMWPWKMNPFYQNISITVDGKTTTAFKGVTAEKGGRSVAWMQPTVHVISGIWADDENDMRISEHNIIRDFQIDNEASPAFGKWFVKDGYSVQANPVRQWFPFVMTKVMGDIPEDYYQKDANGNPILTAFGEHLVTNNGNSTFRDMYMFRLAETYLLRAEAHLGKGNSSAATTDINVVRARAKAKPVEVSKVNIDYLLDERLRELYYEETRMITLCRMGKLVERTKKYNSTYIGQNGQVFESSGTSMQDYHNLWPIPFSEIERNIGAVIEQNPGYTN